MLFRSATQGRWPCTTLHQLLESRGEGEFRRDRQHPLKLDLLVVDEVSMVDLALLEAVLLALPEEARLVLVGDPAQLPPIAPGAPLQELLRDDRRPLLRSAVVTLRTPYRNAGAIAAVASALREQINHPRPSPAHPLLAIRPLLNALPSDSNLHWQESALGALPPVVLDLLRDHLERMEEAARACAPTTDKGWPALMALRDQQLVLTPKHRGPWEIGRAHV